VDDRPPAPNGYIIQSYCITFQQPAATMIPLTKLNNQAFVVNADLIKFIESTPDTLVTLTTGERILVKESSDEVIRRAVQYGRTLRRLLDPS
jgi:flagellar protein FlbD